MGSSELVNMFLTSLISAGLALLFGWLLFTRNMQSRKAEELFSGRLQKAEDLEIEYGRTVERLVDVEKKLERVGGRIVPVSVAFQLALVDELTHFHTPRMDELLKKLGPPYTLTDEEADELTAALDERTRDMGDQITPSEREAAEILPFVIKRVKVESEALEQGSQSVRMVVVIPDTEPEEE